MLAATAIKEAALGMAHGGGMRGLMMASNVPWAVGVTARQAGAYAKTAWQTAKPMAAPAAMVGLTGYAAYSGISSNMRMHSQVNRMMKDSLNVGGFTRAQDFQYSPIMQFTRPRIRGGNLGASGNLTLALSNMRATR